MLLCNLEGNQLVSTYLVLVCMKKKIRMNLKDLLFFVTRIVKENRRQVEKGRSYLGWGQSCAPRVIRCVSTPLQQILAFFPLDRPAVYFMPNLYMSLLNVLSLLFCSAPSPYAGH